MLGAVEAVGKLVVQRKAVKFGGRLIELAAPGTASVEGDTGAAVVALYHEVGIVGVDPEHVGIAMRHTDAGESFAPIDGLHEADIEVVDRVFVFGVGINARVVPGALADAVVATNPGEGFTPVVGAVQAALGFFDGFNLHPNAGSFGGRNSDTHPAYHAGGEPTAEFFPGVAAIKAFPNASFGAAVDEGP